MDIESDEELVARLVNGDHEAFSALVRRHTDRFYACAFRLCGQVEQAEDIVQDAFLKLWSRPEIWKPDKGAKFTTWFYRVVTNMTLDVLRKRKPQASPDVLDYMGDDRQGADIDVIEGEEQRALEGAIQALPERQKVALNLCFYEGMSNKDAADILGVGVKALESLIMRAKASVKKDLAAKGYIDTQEGMRSNG